MLDLANLPLGPVTYFHNSHKSQLPYPDSLKGILNLEDSAQAFAEITQWKDYNPTALVPLTSLANELGVAEIYYKDEGTRLGLGSFKALGGAYGVLKFLQKELSAQTGEDVSMEAIRKGDYSHLTANITIVTATDGNHGRSVAWGANLFGCPCRIYIHAEVSQGRQTAMEALGATVIRIEGNYDESVELCTAEAAENGWNIVSDTSYEGYTEIPGYIMAGYTVMAEEIVGQLSGKPLPTHILLQGGVGGLASALCAYFWEKFGNDMPKLVVVEPDRAPCLIASARAGKLTPVEVEEETIMAGLSCGKPSMLSWAVMQPGIDDFLTISDGIIPHMVRVLADSDLCETTITAGESAVVGLGALFALQQDPKIAKGLGLTQDSRVLLIGTEGATDPEIYRAILAGEI